MKIPIAQLKTSKVPLEMVLSGIPPKAIALWAWIESIGGVLADTAQEQIAEIIEVSDRQLRRLIEHLLKSGWLNIDRKPFGGPLEYSTITASGKATEDIISFIAVAEHEKIRYINLQKLLDIYSQPKRKKLLHVIEVLDAGYTKSSKPIGDVMRLIHTCMQPNHKMDIPDGFIEGAWRKRVTARQAAIKLQAAEQARQRELLLETESMQTFLSKLSRDEYDELYQRALKKLQGNGGVPMYGGEQTIRFEMWELSRKG